MYASKGFLAHGLLLSDLRNVFAAISADEVCNDYTEDWSF
jgi:hypothetical protein